MAGKPARGQGVTVFLTIMYQPLQVWFLRGTCCVLSCRLVCVCPSGLAIEPNGSDSSTGPFAKNSVFLSIMVIWQGGICHSHFLLLERFGNRPISSPRKNIFPRGQVTVDSSMHPFTSMGAAFGTQGPGIWLLWGTDAFLFVGCVT